MIVPQKKFHEAILELIQMSEFTLPNNVCCPPFSSKQYHRFAITLYRLLSFGIPECSVGQRRDCALVTVVHMPEAPMHEDDLPARWKNQVRRAGQVGSMEPETVA